MAKTFELMEDLRPAPSGNEPLIRSPGSRVIELCLVLPAPPAPLEAYVESSDAGNLLFLSGMLPVVDRKLAISGRLGENLSVKQGQEPAKCSWRPQGPSPPDTFSQVGALEPVDGTLRFWNERELAPRPRPSSEDSFACR